MDNVKQMMETQTVSRLTLFVIHYLYSNFIVS